MRYLLIKAGKRFRANIRKYIFLIVQISVGVCMVAVSLNIIYTFQERFAAFRQSIDNLYINIQAGEFYDTSPDALSVDDYQEIQKKFEAEKESISYYKECDLYDAANDYWVPVLFVDDNFYPLLMKAENHQKGSVYIGNRVRRYLSEFMSLQNGVNQDYADAEQDTLFGVPAASFISLEKLDYHSKALLEDGFMSGVAGEVDFNDYIIFPLSIYENLTAPPIGRNSLAISADQNDQANKLTKNILNYLEEQNKGEEYTVTNYYAMAKDNLNRDVHIAELLNVISAFILTIVVFGFLGLLFILIHQRNKEFAIALMCGATQGQIIFEMFIEVLLVVLMGVCIGNLASMLFLPFLGTQVASTTYHLKTFLFTLLGGIGVSALVCLLSLYRIKYISPIRILKNL